MWTKVQFFAARNIVAARTSVAAASCAAAAAGGEENGVCMSPALSEVVWTCGERAETG